MTTSASDRPSMIAPNPRAARFDAYVARTQTPLDLLALLTLWLVVVPPGVFDPAGLPVAVLAARLALSGIYAVDLVIRTTLSGQGLRYVRSHPLGVLAVILPPARVVFSLRLIRLLFRRGHIGRFLIAATILLLDGAVIVFLFERNEPTSTIHTLGAAIWWAVVTVSTVGYGDYTPVTLGGRITASCVMAIAILTLAVVTAQVSSSFVSQQMQADEPAAGDREEEPPHGVGLADLERRLARIEALLEAQVPGGTDQRDGRAP